MTNNVLLAINRFFKDAGHAISTPGGDARGHVRPYRIGDADRHYF